MSQRRKHKPATPEQIAAHAAQRRLEAAQSRAKARDDARQPENWGLAPDTLQMAVNAEVDGQKVGKALRLRRTPWSDRILPQGSPAWHAVNRLEGLVAANNGVREGTDDAGTRSGFGSRELVNSHMLLAGDHLMQVLAEIGPKDRKLLLALIQQTVVHTEATVAWNVIVWKVTGEVNKNAQAAVVRMAASNLAEAFYCLDTAGGWKK